MANNQIGKKLVALNMLTIFYEVTQEKKLILESFLQF